MRLTGEKIALLCLVIAVGLSTYGWSKVYSDKVVIKGSTTVLPITMKCSEAFRKRKQVSISISGTGSGDGIKSLIEGTCDIANSSRQMKSKELASAKNNGIAVKEIAIAYDMIIPVIHPSNRNIKNLTLEQLKGIYDGSITSWKELGGRDEKIVVISRDSSSGTYEVWHEKVMKKTDVRPDALLQASNGAVVAVVSRNRKAIGYIGVGYLNRGLRSVTVNDIQPTIENGKSGKYPVARKLYVYVNENKFSEGAKAFIDFILSREGQKLVKKAGYIPL